jgi:hypothetical protein
MGNLASTYNHLGEFQQAEELEVVVLEKKKQILGVNHPDTLKALWNLASTYRSLNQLSAAEELETLAHKYEEELEGSVNEDSESSEEASEDSTQS